jgi:hypothetical protein
MAVAQAVEQLTDDPKFKGFNPAVDKFISYLLG